MTSRNAITSVAVAWVASRLVIFAAILLFSRMQVVRTSFGTVHETRIDLGAMPLAPALRQTFITGDAEWFRSIAEDGYAPGPFRAGEQRNWAFFPVFPLAVRYLGFFASYPIAAVVLTHAFFIGALFLLYRLAIDAGHDEPSAERTVFYASFFPTSYFFSIPGSEALFVLLACASVLAALARRWWVAALFGALASATRVQGLLLVIVLLAIWWERDRRGRELVPIALTPAGMIAFAAFLYHRTGNALAFADIQRDWQHDPGSVFAPFAAFFRDLPIVSTEWNFRILNAACIVLFVAAVIWLWRDRQRGLSAFVAACLALSLASGSLQSISRYVLTAFPIFIALGARPWPPRVHQALQSAFAILLGALTALFALHYDLAMA